MDTQKREDESQTAWAIRAIRMEERRRIIAEIRNRAAASINPYGYRWDRVIEDINLMED